MGDPMLEAAISVGVTSDWTVDLVEANGRTLIVNPETNLVEGEILPVTGTVMAFDVPYPYEEEE